MQTRQALVASTGQSIHPVPATLLKTDYARLLEKLAWFFCVCRGVLFQ